MVNVRNSIQDEEEQGSKDVRSQFKFPTQKKLITLFVRICHLINNVFNLDLIWISGSLMKHLHKIPLIIQHRLVKIHHQMNVTGQAIRGTTSHSIMCLVCKIKTKKTKVIAALR